MVAMKADLMGCWSADLMAASTVEMKAALMGCLWVAKRVGLLGR
jgi:hypothetical protein